MGPVFRIIFWLAGGVLFIASNLSAETLEKSGAFCINPNQNVGKCISIYECKSLSFVLKRRFTEQYRFVRLSQCDGGSDASGKFVCCTNDTKFHDANTDWQQRIIFPDTGQNGRPDDRHQNVALIGPPLCGALTISNKIYGGEEAEITEFTWMVRLEYRTAGGVIVSECAGSLINERYVLTAAHCVTGPVEQQIGKLVSLSVGENDIHSASKCNSQTCLPPYQRFGIERIVVHERYDADRDLFINEHKDIALIRVDSSVKFDDYLQPVCLPIKSLLQELKVGRPLMAAVWGYTGLSKHSKTKKKVRLPLISMERCRLTFEKLFYVADEQICAGDVFHEDSCSGDSGGPLMRLNSTSWVLEGLVSFGVSCGQENRPGIYTRVRSYIDWIVDHIEPW
ncbi:serine protease 7-like [Eurosta solidaginis]|uniref:serine protease 7-like n=1 Tax=Eurosta solidaginis TaxID=178769 RepID=UPI0035310670